MFQLLIVRQIIFSHDYSAIPALQTQQDPQAFIDSFDGAFAQIVVNFRPTPHNIFPGVNQPNKLVINLQPEDASFRKALGLSYERLQKPAEAAAAYQEYLRLSPAAEDADRVRARIAELTGAAVGAQPERF